MKIRIFFFMSVNFISACSSHSFRINSEPNSFVQLNSQLRGRKGQILLTNGRSFDGKHIVVTENFTTWFDSKLKTAKRIPTLHIEMISIKTKKGNGGLGMLLGALAGGVAGYIILKKTAEDDCRNTSKPYLCLGNELGGLITAILGGGIGYAIGDSFGSTERYIFNLGEH